MAGGLVDIEFLAQFLQLAHAQENPEILAQSTEQALELARDASFLTLGDAGLLLEALRLYHRLTQVLRLAFPASSCRQKHPAECWISWFRPQAVRPSPGWKQSSQIFR